MQRITKTTTALSKVAQTVGVPGRVILNDENYTLVDGESRTVLGSSRGEAEKRLRCLKNPYECWAGQIPEGDLGKPVIELLGFRVGDRIRVIKDSEDEHGTRVCVGDEGEITVILDDAIYAFCVDLDNEGLVRIWLSEEEIEKF